MRSGLLRFAPETGYNFDDTGRYIEASPIPAAKDKRAILAGNARRLYPLMRGF